MKKVLSSSVFCIIMVLLITFPLILPYFHSGYFPSHDGEWAVVRLGDMFRSLKDHQFPVRYSGTLNMEYGYPLFNFAYPFPYYLGIILYFLKLGFIGSIKTIFALTVPFSALAMFFLARSVWKSNGAGIICSILYAYLPYRIVDLYVRGSIGESIALVLFPVLFLAVFELFKKSNKYYLLLGSLSYAALITSHNIMAVYLTPIMICFMAVLFWNKRELIKPYAVLLIIGILLSAFFWLPALAEKHLVLLSQIPIADRNLYFVKPSELVLPKWGFGLPTQKDGFSYQIGIAQVIIFITSIIFVVYEIVQKKIEPQKVAREILFIILIVGMIGMLFPWSGFLWKTVPFLKEINYPWTLLLPIGFLISLLSGYSITKNRIALVCIGLLTLFAIIFSLPHAKPQRYIDNTDQYYLTNEATTTSSHEYMPLWVKKQPLEKPNEKVEVITGGGTFENIVEKSNKITVALNMKNDGIVRINTIYYPGWKITVDNKNQPISYTNVYGVMDLTVPAGRHIIDGIFTETPVRRVADLLSLLGLSCCLALLYKPLAKKLLL